MRSPGKKKYPSFVVLLLTYPLTGFGEDASAFQKDQTDTGLIARMQWESRYVSEGRDNLDNSGIQTTSVDLKGSHFGLSIWNGWGYVSEYDELQLTPSFTHELNNLDIYIYYNYKHYLKEDESENELGSGFSYRGLPCKISLNGDWYYSLENNGSFYKFSIASYFSPVEKFTLNPVLVFGINDNYIPDGHNGANNVGIQLNAGYQMTKHLNLLGYVRYNIAIDSDQEQYPGDRLLNDFYWIGVGIETEF